MAPSTHLDYPFADQSENRFAISWRKKAADAWRTATGRNGPRRGDENVRVWPLSGAVRPLSESDLPLVFVVKDNKRFMRSFVRHYRELGVTRFLCVDDNSIDGTREFLLDQPDVDVFASNVDYKGASRSKRWRELLFDAHGYDRWYLNVDADEFLMFDGCESGGVNRLIAALERDGLRRTPAPMIDAYPGVDISAANFDGSTDAYPWTVANLVDRSGYRLRADGLALRLSGGVRLRVFGVDCEMMKYPVMFWTRSASLGKTIHRPLPARLNFSPIRAVLLHFKIFDDFESDVLKIIKAGQHHNDSFFYRQIAERLSQGEISLVGPESMRFTGSASLRDAGFFAGLDR